MILSYAEFVARKPSAADFPEALIQGLLDAAEEEIVAAYGPLDYEDSGVTPTVEEIITPRGLGELIVLARQASAITEIVEGTVTLAADDFDLRQSGRTVRRLDTGTHPSACWQDRLYITYEPQSEMARRERVQMALVELDISFTPGVTSERIGDWSETISQSTEHQEQRAALLASLNPANVGIW